MGLGRRARMKSSIESGIRWAGGRFGVWERRLGQSLHLLLGINGAVYQGGDSKKVHIYGIGVGYEIQSLAS